MAVAQPARPGPDVDLRAPDDLTRAAGLLLVSAVVATIALVGGHPDLHQVTAFVPSALAVAAVVVGMHRYRPPGAQAWLLLAGGRLALASATTTWSNPRLAGRSTEYVAHLVTGFGYALTAAGLVLLARTLSRLWDTTRWIDSVTLAGSVGLVAVSLLARSNVGAGWTVAWLVPAYPAVDLFLVLLATRVLLAVRQRRASLRLLSLGLFVPFAGDALVRWAGPAGLPIPDATAPIAWAIAGLLVGAAALHPSVADVPGRSIPWRRLGRVRFAVLIGSLAAPLVTLVALGFSHRSSPGVSLLLAAGTATIGVLLLLRVSGLVTYADALADERHRSRFEALAHHSTDAMVILDADGAITWASPAVQTVLGPEPSALLGRGLDAVLGQGYRDADGPLHAAQQLPFGGSAPIEVTLRRPNGAERTIEGVATNLLDDQAVEGIVVVLRDITERAEMERQLVERAFVDPLTGLANRALFGDRVTHALTRATHGPDRHVAILFVDLDDFKNVNDSLGHGPGDDLLAVVGRRIAESIGPADTAARLGGDEFGVLLEEVTPIEAEAIAERILQLLAIPLQVGDFPISMSASIGIALSGPRTREADGLLRNADLAMYEAKRDGKGQSRTYQPHMHERELRQFKFRSDLGAALDRGELEVVYQPIVDMITEQVVGAEALLRWNHPEHGPVSPVEFIPVAESTRAITPIGRWVLETACRQVAEWSGALGPISMDVNVSPIQLLDPDFHGTVAAVLAETGIRPRCLVLELTESLLVHDADVAREALEALRALGVRTAIDDFGTGYSSLAYLQNFPIDIVKIDRAFVSQLGGDARGRSLASSIITIAGSLGIATIAEGIETKAQAADVAALCCMQGQGWHYGRPVDPATFLERATAGPLTSAAQD